MAALLGGVGVLAGAFGAHGLIDVLTPAELNTWQIGARYQMIHAVAMLALNSHEHGVGGAGYQWVQFGFFSGTVLFSGTLYIIPFLDLGWLVFVTPVGGFLLISSWLVLFFISLRNHFSIHG